MGRGRTVDKNFENVDFIPWWGIYSNFSEFLANELSKNLKYLLDFLHEFYQLLIQEKFWHHKNFAGKFIISLWWNQRIFFSSITFLVVLFKLVFLLSKIYKDFCLLVLDFVINRINLMWIFFGTNNDGIRVVESDSLKKIRAYEYAIIWFNFMNETCMLILIKRNKC